MTLLETRHQEVAVPEGYLVDLKDREKEGIRRLLKVPSLSERLFSSLGLSPSFNWYLLEIRMDRLSEFEGDVDVLVGRLAWHDPKVFDSLVAEESKCNPNWHPSHHLSDAALKLVADGGLKWPPPTDYLIGIEAKCARLHPHAEQISQDAIRSKHSSGRKLREIQQKMNRYVKMGFNRVALLDMIATPPASGTDISAWIEASDTAMQSCEAIGHTLNKRLPTNSPAGHWVWPIGAVVGGDEMRRGTGAPIELRSATENPFLQSDATVQQQRRTMEDKLNILLEDLPQPKSFPVIFFDCRTCCKFHSGDLDGCQKIVR